MSGAAWARPTSPARTSPNSAQSDERPRPDSLAARHRGLAAPRDRALALLPFYAGLRIGDAIALDVPDVRISARKGVLIV